MLEYKFDAVSAIRYFYNGEASYLAKLHLTSFLLHCKVKLLV